MKILSVAAIVQTFSLKNVVTTFSVKAIVFVFLCRPVKKYPCGGHIQNSLWVS